MLSSVKIVFSRKIRYVNSWKTQLCYLTSLPLAHFIHEVKRRTGKRLSVVCSPKPLCALLEVFLFSLVDANLERYMSSAKLSFWCSSHTKCFILSWGAYETIWEGFGSMTFFLLKQWFWIIDFFATCKFSGTKKLKAGI